MADVCTSTDQRQHLLDLLTPSGDQDKERVASLALNGLVVLGQFCRSREQLHQQVLQCHFDRVELRNHRSATTSSPEMEEIHRELDYVLQEADKSDMLPSEVVQKAAARKRVRPKAAANVNPFRNSLHIFSTF